MTLSLLLSFVKEIGIPRFSLKLQTEISTNSQLTTNTRRTKFLVVMKTYTILLELLEPTREHVSLSNMKDETESQRLIKLITARGGTRVTASRGMKRSVEFLAEPTTEESRNEMTASVNVFKKLR